VLRNKTVKKNPHEDSSEERSKTVSMGLNEEVSTARPHDFLWLKQVGSKRNLGSGGEYEVPGVKKKG